MDSPDDSSVESIGESEVGDSEVRLGAELEVEDSGGEKLYKFAKLMCWLLSKGMGIGLAFMVVRGSTMSVERAGKDEE